MAIVVSEARTPLQWPDGPRVHRGRTRRRHSDQCGEAANLGVEFATLLDLFGTTLTALVNLRDDSTGQFDRTTWHHMINQTDQLAARLGGIRDALVREHAALGGTVEEPAGALHRRDRPTAAGPGEWERWATGRR